MFAASLTATKNVAFSSPKDFTTLEIRKHKYCESTIAIFFPPAKLNRGAKRLKHLTATWSSDNKKKQSLDSRVIHILTISHVKATFLKHSPIDISMNQKKRSTIIMCFLFRVVAILQVFKRHSQAGNYLT